MVFNSPKTTETLRGDSLLFTTKSPGVPSSAFPQRKVVLCQLLASVVGHSNSYLYKHHDIQSSKCTHLDYVPPDVHSGFIYRIAGHSLALII